MSSRRRLVVSSLMLLLALLVVAGWLMTRAITPTEAPRVARARESSARQTARRPPSTPKPAPLAPPDGAEAPPVPSDSVACFAGPALDGLQTAPILVRRGEGEDGQAEVQPARVIGQWLVVDTRDQASGSVRVQWGQEFGSTTSVATWSEGDCVIERPPVAYDAAVFGRVRGAERLDAGTVFLEGCGLNRNGDAAIDQDGGFYFAAAGGEPCRVRAWRQHGALRLPGPWVELAPTSGGEVDVEVEVPTFAPAGMGIGFRPMADGVVVEQVYEGTPAFEAGLEAGDLIETINGAQTEGMGMDDFLYEGIGPAGTEVTVAGVSAEGEAFETTFKRREISLPR